MNAREAFNQILETIDDAATWLHKNAVDFVEENDLQPRYDIVYAALDRLEAIEKRAENAITELTDAVASADEEECVDLTETTLVVKIINAILNGEGEGK